MRAMAMAERALAPVLLMAMMAYDQIVCHGAVYKVGDSAGWTTIGDVDYKKWASTKTFGLGDVIIFEYVPQFHNVMRVTHSMYKSCNASYPLDAYVSGNDTITITTKGHHYFICGIPGHCQAGQKVDINVLRNSSVVAPTPSALASPSVVPAAKVHTPPSNKAVQLNTMKGGLGILGLIMVFYFVAFVPPIV